MLFLAHINDQGETECTTGFNSDGEKELTRIFHTLAVTDYRPSIQNKKENFVINGKEQSKTVADFEASTTVLTMKSTYFKLPLSYKILDAITTGVHSGEIPRGAIIDLRTDNIDNIKEDYAAQRGHFSYLRKIIK
ncbi:MAG: hypothetical protein NZ828_00320 [Alphaproteobacteria bacterium]|nr:hypothetical protein [Alphaproteobacteria bacterium]